jgi:spore coat polysaccharide biosynthesis predicted glycosyltransferase SpsG
MSVLFKTSGGHKEGMGDVTSSIALANEFIRQGHSVLFMIKNNPGVIDLIAAHGIEYVVVDTAEKIAANVKEKHFDVAVVNQLDTEIDEGLMLRERAHVLMTVEDAGATAGLADIRFNTLYPIENAFTDFSFIPLASVFREKHSVEKKVSEDIVTILVTQGGSDTYGFTPKIVKALYSIPDYIDINVVIGPNFSHDVELNGMLGNSPRKFNIIRGMNDLSHIMLRADLAISAGGNTLFELACLGVPTIVLCAELFEVGTADRLAAEGFGVNLGFGQDVGCGAITSSVCTMIGDVQLRKAMSKRGKALIDGHGVLRMYGKIMDAYHKTAKRMES